MNLSYCRFQNTLKDLQDCRNNIDETLSPEESRARRQLIETCWDILDENNLLTDEGQLEEGMIDDLPVESDEDDEEDEDEADEESA